MLVSSSVCHCIGAELKWSVCEAQYKLQHANANNKRLCSSLIMNHTYKLSENGFSEIEITMTVFWNQWEVLCVYPQFVYSFCVYVKCVCRMRPMDTVHVKLTDHLVSRFRQYCRTIIEISVETGSEYALIVMMLIIICIWDAISLSLLNIWINLECILCFSFTIPIASMLREQHATGIFAIYLSKWSSALEMLYTVHCRENTYFKLRLLLCYAIYEHWKVFVLSNVQPVSLQTS